MAAPGIDRRSFLKWSAGATTALVTQLLSCHPRRAALAASQTNFIVILTDDQGYQDLGCYGSPLIRTPRIDRMAAEGVRFTDFYAAASVCTPSRAALLTGRYPKRLGLNRVLFPHDQIGISSTEVTLPQVLRRAGYATACIGKWHLGSLLRFLPTRHGFDEYFGIPYSNDMYPTPLMRDENVVEEPARQATLTERYTAEAIRFIINNKDRPFFLYLAHAMPHIPLAVSRRFEGCSAAGRYGDAIECLDWSTGEILDMLVELGLDDHTLVVFASDNGPWLEQRGQGGSALPLRGGKTTVYEGGLRVPCVMRWPGNIPPGLVCRELATTMDLLPTMAAVAGEPLRPGHVIDGRDIGPLIRGVEGARSPYDYFYYYDDGILRAVRSGNWKLHLAKDPALYDLAADVAESRNVAPQYPEVVQRLARAGHKFDADLSRTAPSLGLERQLVIS